MKKLEYAPPSPQPSPARGEGEHTEIKKNSLPLVEDPAKLWRGWGRARVGVIYGIISQLQGDIGEFAKLLNPPLPPFSKGGGCKQIYAPGNNLLPPLKKGGGGDFKMAKPC